MRVCLIHLAWCAAAVVVPSGARAIMLDADTSAVIQRTNDADRRDDSLMALRKTFNAYRVTTGVGPSFTFDGISLMLGLSYQHNHQLFTARYIGSSTVQLDGRSRQEGTQDYGLLYGLGYATPHTFVSASAGISNVVHQRDGRILDSTSSGVTYESLQSNTFGIPLQVQTMVTFSNIFGIGLMAYGTVTKSALSDHPLFVNSGITVNMQFGAWATTQPVVRGVSVDESEVQNAREVPSDTRERTARNSVYFELFGAGLVLSANYDRLISDHVSVSAGLSLSPDRTTLVPIMVHYFPFKGNSGLEVGAGVAPGIPDAASYQREGYLIGALHAGYRYQPRDGGDFIRFGITPLYDFKSKFTLPYWFALSGGICF